MAKFTLILPETKEIAKENDQSHSINDVIIDIYDDYNLMPLPDLFVTDR